MGDLSKRFGNPTPVRVKPLQNRMRFDTKTNEINFKNTSRQLGVASFLLCLTPFSCELMGFAGATPGSTVTLA